MVRNSKVLVAGGTGFIGSHLISELISKGNEVISISKNINPKREHKNAQYISHDLTQKINLSEFPLLEDIDYIVNCSGYIDHRSFWNGGRLIFNEHLSTTFELTDLGINLKVKNLIHIGSSDEYGKNKSPINECMRESPISPYALGKLTSTHYLQQCSKEGLIKTVVLRPFLVFGEMQSKNRFLPYLIDSCLKDKDFNVSQGNQIRDYLYIKDFNRALINSMTNCKAYGEVFNIGSGNPISIKEVITNVREIIGKGNPILGGIPYRQGESMKLYADIKKAKDLLNWEPKYTFRESLKQVIEWYSKHG